MTVTGTMTLAEFLALPENQPALEYDNGVVTQKVSPEGRHSALQSGMAEQINRQIRPRRLGRAFTELRATFANLSRVPDIAVYRWNRIPRNAAGEVVDDFLEPPDIAIEIVSPGQSTNRLIERCLTFIEAGAQAAILVDPADHSVALMRAGMTMAVLRAGDLLDLSDIIPDLRLDITALFDELKN
ncbi:MAG: Uma2 family endonuclease [Dehalococcoidia bacterium]